MKTIAMLLILTLGWAPFQTGADGFTYKKRKLAEYVLTPIEYDKLNLEQKVSYFKFLMVFLSTVEDMQDVPAVKKHALRDAIENFMSVLEPKAFAEVYKQEGATCMHSLTLSSYVRSGDHFVCARPASVSAMKCPRGQSGCGADWTIFVGDLGGNVCIVPPELGKHPGHSATCANKIAAIAGVSLDARITNKILATGSDPAARAKFDERSTQMQKALNAFGEKSAMGGLPLSTYCANGNAVNKGSQKEECDSLMQLAVVFHANTLLGKDAFKSGTLEPVVTPELAAAVVRAQSDKGTANTSGSLPLDAAPSPSTGAGISEGAPAPSVPLDPVTPGPSVPLDDHSASIPVDDKAGSIPLDTQSGSIPKDSGESIPYDPPVVAPVPPVKSPPVSCMSRYQTTLGPLACVACGLQSKVNSGPVDKWVALLGAMAQTYYGPYAVNDEVSRKVFQKRVAEMVVSYGYCTNSQFPDDPRATPADADTRRAWVDGAAPNRLSTNAYGGAKERQFAYTFGVMSDKNGGGLVIKRTQAQNWNHPMSYAMEAFDNTNFEAESVAQRQARFHAMARGHVANFPNSGFAKCVSDIERNLKKPAFAVCGSSASAKPLPAMTNGEWNSNQSLYDAMRKSCGFPQRERNDKCGGGCAGSTTFGSSASLNYCKPRVPACPSGNCGGHGGDHDHPKTEPQEPRTPERPEKSNERPGGGTYSGAEAKQ